MSCTRCADLHEHIEIRSPTEFTRTLRVIRANVADGTLADFTQQAVTPSQPFGTLTDDGPWPDFVENYFRCTRCGQRFRLSVDTYHGAGGAWEPYPPSP